MNDRPALLGGTPCFTQPLPIVRPLLPDLKTLTPDLQATLSNGILTKGPQVRAFEEEVAERLEVEHVVAVSSCTSGLMLTYQGLGLHGEVLVPSFTFTATVSAMCWAGLTPVFVDIDPHTFQLDPAAVERAITPQTGGIIAVHTFGSPADINALEAIAQAHDLPLVFDAAHAIGADYQGVPLGRQGDAQVFSLSPTKLVVAGEGGLVLTPHADLAEHLRHGREYGLTRPAEGGFPGLNARMSEFHALLARHSLRKLDDAIAHRNQLVNRLKEQLQGLPGLRFQQHDPRNTHTYKDLAIAIDEASFGLSRDLLQRALTAEQIHTRTYFAPPVHRQRGYTHFAQDTNLPHTNTLSSQILCLPLWSDMPTDILDTIAHAITRCWEHRHDLATLQS